MLYIPKSRNRGFTLIELISVMLIMSILGVIIYSQFQADESKLFSEAEIFKSHLRYLQYLSMSNDVKSTVPLWEIKVTGNGYQLLRDSMAVRLPNENTETHNLGDNITLTVKQQGVVKDTLSFTTWGEPLNNTPYTIELRDSQIPKTYNFEIIKDTGFIIKTG